MYRDYICFEVDLTHNGRYPARRPLEPAEISAKLGWTRKQYWA